jgi:serine/threonine protein kinase
VFSLGVVLYEMATGERPFRGDNEAALISSILRAAPRTPSAVRSGLPQGLDELAACCLEKDPGRRYSTAGELHTALRKLEEARGSGVAAPVRSSLQASVGRAYRTPLIGREEELAAAEARRARREAPRSRSVAVDAVSELREGRTRRRCGPFGRS